MVKSSTSEIIDTLASGEEVALYLIQSSWVRGGSDSVSVNIGTPEKADLIINPSYYEKFIEAQNLDEALSFEEIEQDIEMLAKIMRTAYSKMIGGQLQLILS